MKKLNINMIINANNAHDAEEIAANELANMVRAIAMVTGMGVGGGSAEQISNDKYQVTASVQVSDNGAEMNIAQRFQKGWLNNPNIIATNIMMTDNVEPQQHATMVCANCGQMLMKGSEYIVNPDSDHETIMCGNCLDNALDAEVVVECDICGTYVSKGQLVKNPVTGSDDLCPYCGNKID